MVWNNQLWGLGVDTSGTQGNGMKQSTLGIGSWHRWYTGQRYETINCETSGTQGNGMKQSTLGIGSRDKWYTGQRYETINSGIGSWHKWYTGQRYETVNCETSGTQGNGMKQSTLGIGSWHKWFTGQRYETINCETSGTQGKGMKRCGLGVQSSRSHTMPNNVTKIIFATNLEQSRHGTYCSKCPLCHRIDKKIQDRFGSLVEVSFLALICQIAFLVRNEYFSLCCKVAILIAVVYCCLQECCRLHAHEDCSKSRRTFYSGTV